MNIDKIVLSFAGSMILISLALTYLFNPIWMIMTAFVGIMLFQSGLTGWCPIASILKKLGFKTGQAF